MNWNDLKNTKNESSLNIVVHSDIYHQVLNVIALEKEYMYHGTSIKSG